MSCISKEKVLGALEVKSTRLKSTEFGDIFKNFDSFQAFHFGVHLKPRTLVFPKKLDKYKHFHE